MADKKKRTELDFDEINRLEYEDWFDEMDIEDAAFEERVRAAIAFDNRVGAALAWIDRERPSISVMYDRLYEAYRAVLRDLGLQGEALEERAIQFAEEVTKSTQRHRADLGGYWTSADRAVEIAKNESGLINNDVEYRAAKKSGKTKKTWHTMGDEKVRETHWPMDGVTVGIDEFFNVGGYDMLFPMDGEHGAPPEEIINCRCWVTYS